jgi:hypothetical protein
MYRENAEYNQTIANYKIATDNILGLNRYSTPQGQRR